MPLGLAYLDFIGYMLYAVRYVAVCCMLLDAVWFYSCHSCHSYPVLILRRRHSGRIADFVRLTDRLNNSVAFQVFSAHYYVEGT